MKRKLISSSIFQLLLLIIVSTATLDAQNRKERDSLGITEIEYFDVDWLDSDGNESLSRIERFDERGELIEEIDYSKDGKIKLHIQYVYEGELLMKEIYFNNKGNLEKTYTYEYDSEDLKISKKYFDNKNRIYKEKRYRYKK